MTQHKKAIYISVLLTIIMFANCKKGKSEESNERENIVEDTPTFNLNGSPAENLITVFEAGVTALEENESNPGKAAKELSKILSAVNVESLRKKAKAAKEAGEGATDAEKKRLTAAMEKYKELAASIGGKDPAAFNAVHTKWSAAFGVK
jgi:hypothetical protein